MRAATDSSGVFPDRREPWDNIIGQSNDKSIMMDKMDGQNLFTEFENDSVQVHTLTHNFWIE